MYLLEMIYQCQYINLNPYLNYHLLCMFWGTQQMFTGTYSTLQWYNHTYILAFSMWQYSLNFMLFCSLRVYTSLNNIQLCEWMHSFFFFFVHLASKNVFIASSVWQLQTKLLSTYVVSRSHRKTFYFVTSCQIMFWSLHKSLKWHQQNQVFPLFHVSVSILYCWHFEL